MSENKTKPVWKRKWVVGSFLLVAVLLLAAITLPFAIDLNHFKPQIKAVVSDAVNAEIEFTSIRLTILTGLGVRLSEVTVINTDNTFQGTQIFHVDDVDLRVDLMPLLEKRFEGYLSIEGPEVIVATKGTQNNIAALSKPTEKDDTSKPATKDEAEKKEEMIEEFKNRVVVRSVQVDDARFVLRSLDRPDEEPVRINDLDIIMRNIGLEQDMETLVSTDVDIKQRDIALSGPIRLTLNTKVSMQGSQFDNATFNGNIDLDQFAINVMDAFVKNPGVALNASFSGNAGPNNFVLANLLLTLHTLGLNAEATVTDYTVLDTKASAKIFDKDIATLGEVLPQHKDLLVKGSIDLETKVSGLLSDLAKMTASVDLQSQLTGSDIAMNLTVSDAKAPALNLNGSSTRLDVAAILGPFVPEDEAKPTAEEKKKDAGEEAPPEDFSLSPELKQMLATADVSAKLNFAHVIFDEIEIKEFLLAAKLKDLQARLSPLSLNIFGGSVKMLGTVDLDAVPVAFTGDLDMQGIETQELIALVAAEHKDLLQGRANIRLHVDGQGTTIPTLSNELDGEGRFAFLDGQLNTGSIAAKMGQKLDAFIASTSVSKAAAKAFASAEELLDNPVLQKAGAAKKFDLAQTKTEFDTSSKIQVANKLETEKSLRDTEGRLQIEDGKIHISSQKTSESGTMQLDATVALDATLGGQAKFIASDALKADMKSQSKYASLFFDQSGDFAVPLELSGQAADPKVNVDIASLQKNFEYNTNQLVKNELTSKIEKLKQDLVGGQIEKAKEELAKKKAELKAQADAKKAELAEKKKQAEAEAKKKLEEKKKKEEEAAKAKAKDKLKNVIPGM